MRALLRLSALFPFLGGLLLGAALMWWFLQGQGPSSKYPSRYESGYDTGYSVRTRDQPMYSASDPDPYAPRVRRRAPPPPPCYSPCDY